MVDVPTVLERVRVALLGHGDDPGTSRTNGSGSDPPGASAEAVGPGRRGDDPGINGGRRPATDGGRQEPGRGDPLPGDRDRESVLADLYRASRDLVGAGTVDAIGTTAVETTGDALGLELAALYLDEDGLVPVTGTPGPTDRGAGDPPPAVTEAFGTDDPVVRRAGEGGVFGDRTASLAIGLGEHGVLAAGTAAVDEFPPPTVEHAELLAADVEAALDRARRESLLREREREVRESREKIARLHEAATGVVACRDEDELYDLAVDIAEGVLEFDMSTVMIADGDRLVPRAVSSGAPPDGVRSMGIEEGLAGETYRTGESMLVEDLRGDERSNPVKDSYRSAISVPVGEYGVFQAVATEPRAFDDRDLEFAELLVAHVGETATRIRTERDLRKSEAKFREIAENVESVVWMTDPEHGETLYVSPAFETLWGRSPEPVEEDPTAILDWIHEDDRGAVAEAFEAGDGFDLQYRIRRPGGELRWVHDRAFPIRDGDETSRVVGITVDVTERKRREKELERYQTVFETVQDRVYVLDDEDRFRMVNDPFLSMIGHDRAAVLGEHVSLVFDDGAVEKLRDTGPDPADGDRPDAARTLELTITTADDRAIPCETDVAVLPGDEGFPGTVGVLRDVSDRKRVEAQLQHERDRLSVLFENVPDPVVEAAVDDGRPRIRSVNPAFEEVFGVDAGTVRDDPLAEHVLPPEADPDDDGLGACLDDRAPIQSEVRRRTDEGIRHFLLRGIPFETDADDATGGFGIYTDISDQKRRQRQLQVLNRVLRHNLRNDMNKIIGYAELLGGAADDPTQAARAETVGATAERIVGLSETVRQIGTVLDEDVERARPVDVVELVDGVLDPYRRRRDVEVRVSAPERRSVDADARLELAIEELVENAVEHSDREVPTVEVGVESVDADRGEWVDVVVADDGPGIPAAERTVLTEDREITSVEHGSGLGLWLVNWIVTSLGGDCSLVEDDSSGSVIRLRLRAADPDD